MLLPAGQRRPGIGDDQAVVRAGPADDRDLDRAELDRQARSSRRGTTRRPRSPATVIGWWFDGRATDGTMLPRGRYTATISATDGIAHRDRLGRVHARRVHHQAERHDSGPRADGRHHGVRDLGREADPGRRCCTSSQPGFADWYGADDADRDLHGYKATIRMEVHGQGRRTGRVPGVRGVDIAGGVNSARRSVVPAPLTRPVTGLQVRPPDSGPHQTTTVLPLTGTIEP